MNFIQRHQPASDSWLSDFDRFFNPAWAHADRVPSPGTIYDTPEAWVIRFDLPGFAKDQIKLDVEDRTLQLTAQAGEDQAGRRDVERRWKLGDSIRKEDISARLENGVLEITLPKSQLPQSRNIEIH